FACFSAVAVSSEIPLCPGLTVVTAISSVVGDYESIKTIESITADRIRLKYSSEAPSDMFDPEPIKKVLVYRSVLTKDQQSPSMQWARSKMARSPSSSFSTTKRIH